MSQLYFVLTRRCNQFCTSCPRHQEERIADESFEQVKGRLLNTVKKYEIDQLILSGGEPTLYNGFSELVDTLAQYEGSILIQTNAQKFKNIDFAETCFGKKREQGICVMTAVHSMFPEVHDQITGVPGSFPGVIQAIHNLLTLGVEVTVKCILSKLNYKQLPQYVRWLSEEFHGEVSLCISGMDYIGMSPAEKEEYMLDYRDAVPYLEELFQGYGSDPHMVKKIVLIELPLCMTDEKNWHYFQNTRIGEQLYQDAYMNYPTRRCHDFTTDYGECQTCREKSNCPGVWNEQYKTYQGFLKPMTEQAKNS
jgi:MoaA/NifB/PqqE/SkfB family radical SAM enzyme